MKLVLLLFLYSSIAISQNLVKNPSFEDLTECATQIGMFDHNVIDWKTPTSGSTDLFNSCSKEKDTQVPENFKGTQLAFHGSNYAGIFVLGNHGKGSYREYIEGSLTNKLKANQTYKISFMVSLAEDSDMVVKDLGILFTTKRLNIFYEGALNFQKKNIQNRVAQYVDLKQDQFISNPDKWIAVESTFKATGKEQFFQIGNFKSNKKTTKQSRKRRARFKKTYLYIDMISVTGVEAENDDIATSQTKKTIVPEKIPSVDTTVFKLNVDYQLENLQFYFDSDVIIPESTESLKKVTDVLLKQASLSIHITGHTDQQGSHDYNLNLSEKRSKAIKAYMVENGIAPNRIKTKGMGENELLDLSNTDEAHAVNRRVTFKLSKNK